MAEHTPSPQEKEASSGIRITRLHSLFIGIGVLALVGLFLMISASPGKKTIPISEIQIQKVSASSELLFHFDEAVNQKSVEEELVIPDGVSGDISWKDGVMIYDPSEPLVEGAKYRFAVTKKALKADNTAFGKQKDFAFQVAGTPHLISRIPEIDAVEVPTDGSITMVFDMPMIPLTQIQGAAADRRFQDWTATISPPLPGHWRWLGTTTIAYVPDEGLKAATKYTISVPAGISTPLGDQTQEDYSWSFETQRPEAQAINPVPIEGETIQQYGPKSQVLLSFNLPMSLGSAKDHIRFYREEINAYKDPDPLANTTEMSLKAHRYHRFETENGAETDETTLVLEPVETLEFNGTYMIQISAGITSTEGDLGSPEDQFFHFSTVGDLTVMRGYYEYFGIQLDFSNSIVEETLRPNLSIDPLPEDWENTDVQVYSWDKSYLRFYPQLRPSTLYTVRINTGLRDQFGQSLKEPYQFEFTTEPVPSRVFIHSDGEFGIFERERPPVYYLNAVNVSELTLKFTPLSLTDFLDLREKQESSYDFRPDFSGYKDSKSLTLQPPKKVHDQWEAIPFDLEEQWGELGSGIYGFSMQAPEYTDYNGNSIIEVQYFALTDMALTLKNSGSKALVWLTNTQTGEPISDAVIQFYSLSGELPVSGKTDRSGFFEADLPLEKFVTGGNTYSPEFYVIARKDDDFTFTSNNWNNGLEPYQFGLPTNFQGVDAAEYTSDSYVYTDRPIYRAGDTVHFKGIVRLRENASGQFYMPKNTRKAVVTISDAMGQEVYNKTLGINPFGSFDDQFSIDEAGSLGDYRLNLQVTPDGDLEGNYGGASFSVLAYRKPEYRVELMPQQEDYFDDDTISVDIDGSYYFGAPLSGAKLNWRAQSTDYFFNQYTDGYYSFALEDAWCWWDCERSTSEITSGEGVLDDEGHFQVQFPFDLNDKSLSQVATIEADVFDPNNQVVSNRVSVPVHKANIYVGIRPRDYAVAPGEKAGVELVTVNPDGSPKPNQSVTIKLFTREWNSIRKKGVDGKYYYDNEPEDTFLRETSVHTDEEGKAVADLLIEKGGQHRFVASVKDEEGRETIADTSIYAYSSTYINWPRANNDRVDIIADKPEYRVGDTAKLLVKSPFQGDKVKALVTVEREQIISKKVITVESNAQAIEIPITEDLIPNAFVSVVIIKPRDGETFNENGLDTGTPAFRIGYTRLRVETSRKELSLGITTDKPKYGPGETVQVSLSAKDWEGNPVQAELSLGVVDLSVLALTGFQLPDLVDVFYSQRGLGINTTQTLLYLIERFKPGSKGGGGADPEMKQRGNFKDTAYWDPSIFTNEKGEASVTFELPDNLTTWQLLAVANTKEHSFGAKVMTIIETKKVILRPVRPRFAVAEDEIKIGAIVHNFLPGKKTFSVTLQGSGFTPQGEMTQSISLEEDAQGKLLFPVRADFVDEMTLTFAAKTEGGQDEIVEKIPVYVFGTPQSVATSGVTEDKMVESVLVPTLEDAREGELSITVAPTLGTYLTNGLQYLATYPYGCAEQVMSSFLPNVVLKSLQGFEAFKIVDDVTLEKNVSEGLQMLYSYQHGDGGFGYWQSSPRSYAYLSAYILFGLQKSQQAGYSVDQGVIDRTRDYLDGVLRTQNLEEYLDLATRAFILYVLAEGGGVDASLVDNLYQSHEQLPVFGQAMLAMTLHHGGTSSALEKANSLIEVILQRAKVDARGTHFEEKMSQNYRSLMNTNTRTTALVLQALVRLQPEHPLIPRVVRYLLAVREQGHWDTTQSTTMSLLAFIEFLRNTGELSGDFTADVTVGEKDLLDKPFNSENILTREKVSLALDEMTRGEENLIGIAKEGSGRLYYDLLLSYFYTADIIPPADEGIGIAREMETVGEDKDGVVNTGDTYRVTLTITVPRDRHFVAVESPIPAGMELIDLRLQTTQQSLLEDEANDTDGWMGYWDSQLWRFNHIEYRDDQVFLFADELPMGVYQYEYLVRATTPGKYHYRPARVYEMYFPETFGQTGGDWFDVAE